MRWSDERKLPVKVWSATDRGTTKRRVTVMTQHADTVPSAEDWRRAVDWIEAQYPPAVFPPDSDSIDAKSGTFARHVCRNIRKEARRIMDARNDGTLRASESDGGLADA